MAKSHDPREELAALRAEVEWLRMMVDRVRARVQQLESAAPAAPPEAAKAAPPLNAPLPPPPVTKPAPPPLPATEETPAAVVMETPAVTPSTPPTPPTPPPAAPPVVAEAEAEVFEAIAMPDETKRRGSLEAWIGGKWLNWVGIVAMLFGTAYFLKYAFDSGWITAVTVFYGGVGFGAALLVTGAICERRGYPIMARALWGGGIGVLYLVFFAGHKLLRNPATHGPVIAQTAAFAGMVFTSLAGAALSIRFNSRSTICLAAVGGYLCPILLGPDFREQVFLFTYLAILSAAMLAFSCWRGWRFLGTMAFIAVTLYVGGWWAGERADANTSTTMTYLSLFFAMFTAEPMIWSLRRRERTGAASAVRLPLATLLFVAAMNDLLMPAHADARGVFHLAVAAWFLAGLALVAWRHPEDQVLRLSCGDLAAILFLLAPFAEERLSGYEVTIAWAVQGAALFAFGLVWRGERFRSWGAAGLALAAARLLAYDVSEQLGTVTPYRPLWNVRGLAFGAVTAALAAVAWAYRRIELRDATLPLDGGREPAWPLTRATLRDAARRWLTPRRLSLLEHEAATLMLLLAVSVPMVFASLEFVQAFKTYAAPHIASATHAQWQQRLWMTLMWGGYAVIVALIASRRGESGLRACALAFLGGTLAKLVLYDLAMHYWRTDWLFLNARFVTLTLLALGLAGLGADLRRKAAMAQLGTAAQLLANLLVAAALSMEWNDYCIVHRVGLDDAGHAWGSLAGAATLGMTLLWALHGALLAAWSHGRKEAAPFGVLGLLMVGVALFYWLAFTVSGYHHAERPLLHFRFASGAALAAVLFRLGGRRDDMASAGAALLRAAMTLVAHGLMILLLTLEANDLFSTHATARLLPAWLNLRDARQLAFSGVWTVYAIGMVLAGFLRAYRALRLMALAVLAVSIVKVFAFDLAFLRELYRVGSLFVLAAILLGVSFLYQRYKERIFGE